MIEDLESWSSTDTLLHGRDIDWRNWFGLCAKRIQILSLVVNKDPSIFRFIKLLVRESLRKSCIRHKLWAFKLLDGASDRFSGNPIQGEVEINSEEAVVFGSIRSSSLVLLTTEKIEIICLLGIFKYHWVAKIECLSLTMLLDLKGLPWVGGFINMPLFFEF